MREVNFSIPNVNKASVGITTALYDRRALDCTSTLPLINSLNHLAYLTTSSARIRDILTVDGGVERLVCILKEGRSQELMNMWKWNLAFQCVVNIGVRGSENVRTRVVEADMVPVIATILDNYIQVMEHLRTKEETNMKRSLAGPPTGSLRVRESRVNASSPFFDRSDRSSSTGDRSSRRAVAPTSIDIPVPFPNALPQEQVTLDSDLRIPTQPISPPTSFDRVISPRPRHNRSQSDVRHYNQNYPHLTAMGPHRNQLLGGAVPPPLMDMTETFGFRPVRDVDRLPSMLSGFQGTASQPESPTTPGANQTQSLRLPRRNSRPSVRHQRSMSGGSDEENADEVASNTSGGADSGNEPIVDLQPGVITIRGEDSMLETDDAPMTLEPPSGEDNQDAETFNITHRNPIDGSIINPGANAPDAIGFSPGPTTGNNVPPAIPPPNYPRYILENPSQPIPLPSMPRDDDVLMSLQLLAYVSKYTNLRSYFQKSHLVPKLSINNEMHVLDEGEGKSPAPRTPAPEIEEYLLPDDFNIFPLVEKFTVRHYAPDMQYWAGVVMRNLCRKDDSRGGIRQCAYFQCGKWEEYTRQFAKCRRCRRTKYCSKDCQKSAWIFHRHWCVAAQ